MTLTACAAEPVSTGEIDAAGPMFLDAGAPRDGAMVRDAAPPLPDVSVLTDAGAICRLGAAAGTVCTPSGEGLAGAQITALSRNCNGAPRAVNTESDARGYFRLEGLAPGPTPITIAAGRFLAQVQIEAIAGTEVPVSSSPRGSPKVCLDANGARLAVLTGDYDRVEEALDGLGFAHDLYCGDSQAHRGARGLLMDAEALAGYDVLFVNCATGIDLRATNPEVALIRENLRAFIARGGSLYASDLAADFVGVLWPDKVDFIDRTRDPAPQPACCVCADCPPECIAPPTPADHCPLPNDLPFECRGLGGGIIGRGAPGVVPAEVRSPVLARFLEADTLDVQFNLAGWIEIAQVADDVDVLVASSERPLMIAFTPVPGGGRVAYTSFHHHAQATEAMRRLLQALVFQL